MHEPQPVEQIAGKLDPEADLADASVAKRRRQRRELPSAACRPDTGARRDAESRPRSAPLSGSTNVSRAAREQRRGLRRLVEHGLDRVRRVEQRRRSRRACPSRVPTAMWISWTRSSAIGAGARHDVHDAGRGADAAERQQPRACELARAAAAAAASHETGRRDRSSAHPASSAASITRQVEVVMARIDDDRRAVERLARRVRDAPRRFRRTLTRRPSGRRDRRGGARRDRRRTRSMPAGAVSTRSRTMMRPIAPAPPTTAIAGRRRRRVTRESPRAAARTGTRRPCARGRSRGGRAWSRGRRRALPRRARAPCRSCACRRTAPRRCR